jgi:dTDP-4-dehydrorhamnose 3,5-epimerase
VETGKFSTVECVLPQGVYIKRLETHHDARGALTEVFRNDWNLEIEAVQWNVVSSAPRVMRGVHVHVTHSDYILVVQGSMILGLHDLRNNSLTKGLTATIELHADNSRAVIIPPGVAHGFYFPEASMHLYCVSHYWDPQDELGCHYADKELNIAWPDLEAIVSERDEQSPSLRELKLELKKRGF